VPTCTSHVCAENSCADLGLHDSAGEIVFACKGRRRLRQAEIAQDFFFYIVLSELLHLPQSSHPLAVAKKSH
jgi:hypothetical protein